MRDVLYCAECGARLNLYVVGVCSRCHFDLTGEDPDRDAREARSTLQAPESDGEVAENQRLRDALERVADWPLERTRLECSKFARAALAGTPSETAANAGPLHVRVRTYAKPPGTPSEDTE